MEDRHLRTFFKFLIICHLCFFMQPAESSENDLFIYSAPLFEFIFPDNDITKEKEIHKLAIRAAKNEYEPVTFIIYSKKDFVDVSIKITDLKNGNGYKYDSSNLDIRIVKVWKQFPPIIEVNKRDEELYVPELLVKNDIIEIKDGWDNDKFYIPPSFPLEVKTTLNKNQSKQFWITVRIPKDMPKGIYKGNLLIISKGETIRILPFEVEVLPFMLPQPEKIYTIYFKPVGGINHQPKEMYMKLLRDIKEHGFEGVTIWESDIKNVEEAFRRIKEVGLRGPVIQMVTYLTDDYSKLDLMPYVVLAKKYGYEQFFYGQDEPFGKEKMNAHILKSYKIHGSGGKVVTAITRELSDKLLDRNNNIYKNITDKMFEPLDWANLNLRKNPFINGKRHKKETYYWQIWTEIPIIHRLYSGFFLWKSQMDGIFPYGYCYEAIYPESPYKSDKRFAPYAGKYFKYFNVTYPSKEGPVPTLQWEAIREGIDDVRYLTKLRELSLRVGKNSEISAKIEKILKDFDYIGVDNTGKSVIAPEQFRIAREKIIALILQLQREDKK